MVARSAYDRQVRIAGLRIQLKPAHREAPDRATPTASLAGQLGNRALLALARSRRDAVVPATTGRPLPSAERTFFESRYGASLDGVRLHTGSDAHELARDRGALAYTYGRDIVFGADQYRPETREGRHLLAHELAHVVQGGDAVQRRADERVAISQPHDAAEREADRAATAALDPAHARVPIERRSGPPTIRRAIPDPAAKERRDNKIYIELYDAKIRLLRLNLQLLARFGEPVDDEAFERALDNATTVLRAYEKGYGISGGGATPLLGLAVSGPITATPVQTPSTTTGATGASLLGVGVAIGIGITSLIWSATTSSGVEPVKWSDVKQMMKDLDKLFEPLAQKLQEVLTRPKPTPQPQPQPQPQPEPTPEPTPKKDPDPQPCPAGTTPYSQAAAVARVTELIGGAPQRIGEAGRAKTMGSARFLAAIKSNAAVISIVTKEECVLASAEGTHDVGDSDHAEEVALARLAGWRSATTAIPRGTRLSVVVSANPCGEDRHDCWGKLSKFARAAPILAYDPSKGRYLLTVSGIRPRP